MGKSSSGTAGNVITRGLDYATKEAYKLWRVDAMGRELENRNSKALRRNTSQCCSLAGTTRCLRHSSFSLLSNTDCKIARLWFLSSRLILDPRIIRNSPRHSNVVARLPWDFCSIWPIASRSIHRFLLLGNMRTGVLLIAPSCYLPRVARNKYTWDHRANV